MAQRVRAVRAPARAVRLLERGRPDRRARRPRLPVARRAARRARRCVNALAYPALARLPRGDAHGLLARLAARRARSAARVWFVARRRCACAARPSCSSAAPAATMIAVWCVRPGRAVDRPRAARRPRRRRRRAARARRSPCCSLALRRRPRRGLRRRRAARCASVSRRRAGRRAARRPRADARSPPRARWRRPTRASAAVDRQRVDLADRHERRRPGERPEPPDRHRQRALALLGRGVPDVGRPSQLTGVGAGGYATARPRYRQDLLDVRHAHGYVPETMAELGPARAARSASRCSPRGSLAARTAIRARARAASAAGLVTLAADRRRRSARTRSSTGRGRSPAPRAVGARRRRLGRRPRAGRRLRRAALAAARREPRASSRPPSVVVVALAAAWTAWQPLRARDEADDALAALRRRRHRRARASSPTSAARHNPLSIEPLFDLAAIEQRAGRQATAPSARSRRPSRLQPANWLPWMRLTDFRLFELNDAAGRAGRRSASRSTSTRGRGTSRSATWTSAAG